MYARICIYRGVHIKWALEKKNITDTWFIDIKTKADTQKKGRNSDCSKKPGKRNLFIIINYKYCIYNY